MNKKRFIVGVFALLVFAAVILLRRVYQRSNSEVEVAVVIKSTESNFWKEFMKGIQAGSIEYNVSYYCTGPRNEEAYEEQNEMLRDAIDRKVDVIIFSAISAKESVPLIEEAKKKGIYVIIVDSGVDTDDYDMQISTDNTAAGIQLADAVTGINASEIYVGIVNFDAASANGQERERGFRDAVAASDNITIVDSVNVASNIADTKTATKRMLEEHPEINAIITMNEWTTLGVGYAIEEVCAGGVQVYGFDSNVLCLDMLEKGYLDGLIVQNPYAMGYLSIENAYRLFKHKKESGSVIYTNTELVTRQNMYDEDIQKMIFPIKK